MTTPTPTLDPAEVQVGTANGPGLYIAPAYTPGPDTTTGEWPAPWQILGYLSEDGPTISMSTDSEVLTPWQSRSSIRTVITGRQMTAQFVLWQLNRLTLAVYFDADPPEPAADGSIQLQVRTDTPQHEYALGIDNRDERVFRVAFHRASLSDAGDMQLTKGAAVPLDCTLTALDDGGVLADVLLGPVAAPVAAQPAQARPAVKQPAAAGQA